MRGEELKLVWQDEQGVTRIERVKPVDVRADCGVEYLFFQDMENMPQRVRLDHILRAHSI